MTRMTQERQPTEAWGDGNPISGRVLGAFFDTYNALGWGFLEAVYKRGLAVILAERGASVRTEVRLPIHLRGVNIGDYYADMIVDDSVIVECKTVERLMPPHRRQLINYLRATPYEVGLLLNFGESPRFERLILTNDRKRDRRP